MATVFIAAIAAFSILFGIMMVMGLIGQHPWLLLLPVAYYVYKEVGKWRGSTRKT